MSPKVPQTMTTPPMRAGILSLALLAMPLLAQSQSPADAYNYARTTAYTYRADGLVETETIEPSQATQCVVSTYSYDAYGNRSGVSVANCAGASGRAVIATRSSTTSYASQTVSVVGVSVIIPTGAVPVNDTNALSQTSTRNHEPRFGVLTQEADPNNLAVQAEYDDFGRKTREIRVDGTRVLSYYCYLTGRVTDTGSNSAGCPTPAAAEIPADAVMFVHVEPRDNSGTAGVKNGPFSRTYSDRAGRTIRSVSEAFDGASQPGGTTRLIVKDTDHSPYGPQIVQTQPYFLDSGVSTATGTTAYGMTYSVYDALGRTTTTYTADAQGSQTSVAFGSRGSRRAAWTRTTYTGLNSTTTNDIGQSRQEERNVDGKVARITDALGAQIVYQHDAFGNLLKTKDALQNTITLSYDHRGRKLSLIDPDAGAWGYCYDVLGQLKAQQNGTMRGGNTLAACPNNADSGTTATAAAQWTTLAYDKLGRVTQRIEPEATSTWTYDQYANASACTKGIGKLCEVVTSNGLNRKNVYDSTGRLVNVRTNVTSGPSFASALGYDSVNGRLASRTYPTGVRVNYNYTTSGYLSTLTLATAATVTPLPATPGGTPGTGTSLGAGAVLWQAQAYNAWGQLEQQSVSNGVIGKTSYDPQSDRIAAITAGTGTTTTVLNHAYGWDSIGHLGSRIDNNGDGLTGAVNESFGHDALGRLSSYTVAAPAVPNLARSVTLQYNALGSILYKSDVGNYSYPAQGAAAVRPHAVQSISGESSANYTYDFNGNLKTASAGKYRSIAYTSFNLPDSQQGVAGPAGSPAYTWQYDDQHQRFKETRVIAAGTMAGTRTTWMLHPDNAGGLAFESEVNSPTSPSAANPSATSNRHYLEAGGQSIGVLVSSGALPTLTASQTAPTQLASVTLVKVEYWHKDHLGSLAATTDHAAAVTARYSYDPFGKRRYASGSYDPFGALVIDWSPAVNAGGDRGFTGHEQLDDVGLVHMNGRIYDANIGRFVQPDPQITFPEDLRNFDRYAYVLNDPLGTTDPTGLAPEANNNRNNDYNQWKPGCNIGCVSIPGGSGLEAPTSNSESKGTPGQGGAGTQPQGKPDYTVASTVAGGSAAAKGAAAPAAAANSPGGPFLQPTWGEVATGGAIGAVTVSGAWAAFTIGAPVVSFIGFAGSEVAAVGPAAAYLSNPLVYNAAAVGTIGIAAEVGSGTASPSSAAAVKPGSFSIVGWAGYPAGVAKPQGPFRLIEGAEYDAARSAANAANGAIRRELALKGKAVDVHEVQPVKLGGSPTDKANKAVLPRDLHRQQVTPWWNQLVRDISGR